MNIYFYIFNITLLFIKIIEKLIYFIYFIFSSTDSRHLAQTFFSSEHFLHIT